MIIENELRKMEIDYTDVTEMRSKSGISVNRDYLNEYPEIAKEYGELKRVLKEKYEHNRDAYTAAKGDFIGRITSLARKEYSNKYFVNGADN